MEIHRFAGMIRFASTDGFQNISMFEAGRFEIGNATTAEEPVAQ
jgi:hypothetical protein